MTYINTHKQFSSKLVAKNGHEKILSIINFTLYRPQALEKCQLSIILLTFQFGNCLLKLATKLHCHIQIVWI